MRKSPPLHVAVIGAGAIGQYHVEEFQKHPQVKVVAIAEVSQERAQATATKFDIPEAVSDYKMLLKRKDIHAFSIALPNYLHAPVGLEVLRAKKHLMLDKPMATNARDAAKLVAEAKRQRVVFMVGQNQRFSGPAQTIKALALEGKFGNIYHAKATWMRRSGIPRIGSWFTQTKFSGGGCTYDIGVHVLDLALHLMNEFEAVSVSGRTFTQFGNRGLGDGGWGQSEVDWNKPFDVDDLALALIKLRSGRTVSLEASWAAHQATDDVNGVQIFGTEAGATTNPLQVFRFGKPDYVVETPKTTLLVEENRMAHFANIIFGKVKPFCLPAQSLAVQKILDAIYLSSKTGREVRLRK
jgi:predicted dehydrogenase